MNYLAHIQLGHTTDTSLLGNFLGDFVKGSDLSGYPLHIRQGIILHRKVDTFTDNHEAIKALRDCFPSELRRMAGIIIDVYFDHLLCLHWQQLESNSRQHVLNSFYQELSTTDFIVSKRFTKIKQSLLDRRWLSEYQEFEGVIGAFLQIERRLNNKIKFAASAEAYLLTNSRQFQQTFLSFYPDLTEFALSNAQKLDKHL